MLSNLAMPVAQGKGFIHPYTECALALQAESTANPVTGPSGNISRVELESVARCYCWKSGT